MSPPPIITRKTVPVGSLARVLSRSESPDPLSLPGVTDFGLSRQDLLTDDHQVASIVEDDTESNETESNSASFSQNPDCEASSGDESWSPRSKGRFSANPSRLSPSTKKSVKFKGVSPTAERQPLRDRDIYDIPSDTDSESSKKSQSVLVRSLNLGKLNKPKPSKKQRNFTKIHTMKHKKRQVRNQGEHRISPAAQSLNSLNPPIAAPSEQSFKDSLCDGRSDNDEAIEELKKQQRMRTERFVHSWMSFNEAVTTEMTKEKAAERSREVFEGEPMLWL